MRRSQLSSTQGRASAASDEYKIQAVTAEDAAKLKKELTPVGATRAGNADGSIPAWTGGITEPVAGYKKGDHHPDPIAADQVMFTINDINLEIYKDNFTQGQVKLFENNHVTVYYTYLMLPTKYIVYNIANDGTIHNKHTYKNKRHKVR